MTIIGPGSEWFWSALSGLVVAATLLTIYRQLREQRAAALYDQIAAWERDWEDLDLAVIRLASLIDFEHRPTDDGLPRSFEDVGAYFERLGYLVSQRHLRAEDVWQSLRRAIGWWWALAGPYIERQRAVEDYPGLFDKFENLEQEMRRLDRKTGQEMSFDVSSPELGRRIDSMSQQIRTRSDARNGILPRRKAGRRGSRRAGIDRPPVVPPATPS